MKRRFLLIGFASALLTACATTSPTPLDVASTQTPRPPSTLIPPTATPLSATLRITEELVNCRFGPGIVYELINELDEGQSARVVGRNNDSTWWYIRDPGNPNGFCWVSASAAKIKGATEKLPVTRAPYVTVTNASLRIEPNRIVVNCDKFPQTVFFEAKVTANGPAFATWKWETSDGVSSDNRVIVFEEAGTKVVNDYYQIGAPNEYWIKLRILAPNEVVKQVNFPVNCSP